MPKTMRTDRLEEVFSKRIKELRLQKGLTLTKAANDIKITKGVYAGYESGAKFPSIGTMERLAVNLGTSVDYLIGLTDNPVPLNIKLDDGELHWNGEPLSDEQLELLAKMLRTMMKQNNWLESGSE